MMEQMTDDQFTELGLKIIEIFDLEIKDQGRVDTAWGNKTVLGLGKTIARITKELVEQN